MGKRARTLIVYYNSLIFRCYSNQVPLHIIRIHFPTKFGFLFSANALSASTLSSVGMTCTIKKICYNHVASGTFDLRNEGELVDQRECVYNDTMICVHTQEFLLRVLQNLV